MWYCYVIRRVDKFKHLGMITENLDEIDCFIRQVTKLHNDVDFLFLIERK